MSNIGKPEREMPNRVIALFRDELRYRYLGDRADRPSNIEEDLLGGYLRKADYSKEQISRALYLLRAEANNPNRNRYDNNKAVPGGMQSERTAGRRLCRRWYVDFRKGSDQPLPNHANYRLPAFEEEDCSQIPRIHWDC